MVPLTAQEYTNLIIILHHVMEETVPPNLYSKVGPLETKLAKIRCYIEHQDRLAAEAAARRQSAVPILATDFSKVPIGTLVKPSDYYVKQYPGGYGPEMYGIVKSLKAHVDALAPDGYATWPMIHWEGDTVACQSHPACVVPARKEFSQIVVDLSQR